MIGDRSQELAVRSAVARDELGAVHAAREVALRACRTTIQASGRAIRALHRGQDDDGRTAMAEAGEALASAQAVLADHPMVAAAGFLHDAEKEYAEASLFAALIGEGDEALPGHEELAVSPAAWLNGLAEAASELRRHALDRLRAGALDDGEAALTAMDDVYGVLVTVDYPDAVTGGLRRTTDALRAVLERTRSDLTTTVLQHRLQTALEARLDPG